MLAPRINRGFLWLTLLLLVAGGVGSYLLYSQPLTSDFRDHYRTVIAATVVLAGLSFIGATSGIWIRED